MSPRRRKGRPINGILVLDKPAGYSSNQALQAAKRLFFAAKAGHTGSLDPIATGVLPLCFGEATKFAQFLLDADKAYRSTFALGVETDTGDADGEAAAAADASGITRRQVEKALRAFQGRIEQVPPMHSAVKRGGQPLYKLAREGKEVERESRAVTVHELTVLEFRGGERAEVDVFMRCSKGTYVRVIAQDAGRALGVGAHVAALRRTASGHFAEADAVPLDALEEMKAREAFAEMDALLRPPDAALGDLPLVRLSEAGGFYLRQGQPVQVPKAPARGMVRLSLENGEFLGVGEILDDGRVAPRRLAGG